jgi:transposase
MQRVLQKYAAPVQRTGGSEMMTPEDVAAIVRLSGLGWGSKKIARELKISRNTVKKHMRQGRYVPYRNPERTKALDGLEAWLKEKFLAHRGNADVVRQELEKEHKIFVSLRTIQRAVEPYRRDLVAQAQATVRFETPPGKQLQVDFGTTKVVIGGERQTVQLCVLTLGYSRRTFVQAFPCQRLAQWLEGLESCFHHFGGVPDELLVDNAPPLVRVHDLVKGEVRFTDGFDDFCRYWNVRPKACAPYRARTKGKDERMVQYVKRNALAGREFTSWPELEEHLQWWMREVADERVHGTVQQRPIDRFETVERHHLRPMADQPRYMARRELIRKVKVDGTVEVDTNHYSVPIKLLGRRVDVLVTTEEVIISMACEILARHRRVQGRNERIVCSTHLDGVVRGRQDIVDRYLERVGDIDQDDIGQRELYSLLRPLSEYEEIVGGAA